MDIQQPTSSAEAFASTSSAEASASTSSADAAPLIEPHTVETSCCSWPLCLPRPSTSGNTDCVYKVVGKEKYRIDSQSEPIDVKANSFALSTWIEYWGDKLCVDVVDSKNKLLIAEIETFVDTLVGALSDVKEGFRWERKRIGSLFDGTKKRPIDEFDFLFVAVSANNIRFDDQSVPTTAAQGESKPDFFRASTVDGQELSAKDLRESFQRELKAILAEKPREHGDKECYTETNGPALSFYISKGGLTTWRCCSPGLPVVKVDVTMAIAVQLQDQQICGRLNPDVRSRACHMVPHGDLWRLSFACQEGDIIRNLSADKRNCLVAIKHLRDFVAVTHGYEQSTINSYYLKTAFLNEVAENGEDVKWKGFELAQRAANILNHVKGGTLQHHFIDNLTVYSNPHEDRSSMEARLLVKFLKRQRRRFNCGVAMACLLCVLFALVVVSVISLEAIVDGWIKLHSITTTYQCPPLVEYRLYLFILAVTFMMLCAIIFLVSICCFYKRRYCRIRLRDRPWRIVGVVILSLLLALFLALVIYFLDLIVWASYGCS